MMLRETAEAPDVVARLIEPNDETCRALGMRLRERPPRFAVTCARGSSDSAATYAKYLFELRLGTVVASVGPSVASIYGKRPKMGDALFLAISQSGQSPDLLTLAEAARKDGALTVAVGQRHRLAPCRALRGGAAAPCRTGAERRRHQVLHRLPRRHPAARRPLERRRHARHGSAPPSRRSQRRARPRLAGGAAATHRDAEPLRRRPRPGLRRRPGGGAEDEGNLRPPCRSAERGGAEARTAGAGRPGVSRSCCSASGTRRSPD